MFRYKKQQVRHFEDRKSSAGWEMRPALLGVEEEGEKSGEESRAIRVRP